MLLASHLSAVTWKTSGKLKLFIRGKSFFMYPVVKEELEGVAFLFWCRGLPFLD